MSRRKPTALADLDELIDAITVDAYGDDKPQTAFLEVSTRRCGCRRRRPCWGLAVDVAGFDYHDERLGIIARCRRDGIRQDLAVVDLSIPFYEFLAIDRPVDARQPGEVLRRALSANFRRVFAMGYCGLAVGIDS